MPPAVDSRSSNSMRRALPCARRRRIATRQFSPRLARLAPWTPSSKATADFAPRSGRLSGRATRRWRLGTEPETMVIACSDLRRSADGVRRGSGRTLRGAQRRGPVPPFAPDAGYHGTSAALEFAVKVLKVARLVVLGHGQCGGVRAMVYGPPPKARDFIASWVELGKPALAAAGDVEEGRLGRIEAEVVRLSLKNLITFPWIGEAVLADGSSCRATSLTSTPACWRASARTGSSRSTNRQGPDHGADFRDGQSGEVLKSTA